MWVVEWKCVLKTHYTSILCKGSNGNVSWKHVTPTLNVRSQREMCPENIVQQHLMWGVEWKCALKHVTPTLTVRGRMEMCPENMLHQHELWGVEWKCVKKTCYTNINCEWSNAHVSWKHDTPTLTEMIRFIMCTNGGSNGNVSWKHVTPTLNVRGRMDMSWKHVTPTWTVRVKTKCVQKTCYTNINCEGSNAHVSWKHDTSTLTEMIRLITRTNGGSNGNVSWKQVTPTLNMRGQMEMCPENMLDWR